MTVTPLTRFTIGGSECAAAAGVHPYLSRIELWATMTGRMPRPESEAMAWGKRLEPLIDEALSERGYELMPAPADAFTDPERKWCVGHPDGFVVLDGERAVYERKTIGQWAHHSNGRGVPPHYECQGQWYMHLTGLRRTLFAFLVGGQRLELVEVERSDWTIARLLELSEAFLKLVRADKMPAPDDSQSARDTVRALFPEAERSKLIRLDAEHWRYRRELDAVRQAEEAIKEQRRELESKLQAFMRDAELAISPHDTDAARWSNVQSRRLDQKALKEARPDVFEEFSTVTTTRRFTLL